MNLLIFLTFVSYYIIIIFRAVFFFSNNYGRGSGKARILKKINVVSSFYLIYSEIKNKP